jgi:IS30 family transposase
LEERDQTHSLRTGALPPAAIARVVRQRRSTIGREFQRKGRLPIGQSRTGGTAGVRPTSWSRLNRRITPRQWTLILRYPRAD